MYYPVELVLKSYMPKQLEPGMWFINKLHQGTIKEQVEIWALEKVPFESLEEFVTKHGAPVEPYLIYDELIVAEPEEIGWWDEGDHVDELRDITLKDINYILNEWDGAVYLDIDDETFEEEDEINPILYDNKVTLALPYEEEEEEEEEDDDEGPEFDGAGFSHEDNITE
jgi:hypothetical protein